MTIREGETSQELSYHIKLLARLIMMMSMMKIMTINFQVASHTKMFYTHIISYMHFRNDNIFFIILSQVIFITETMG